MQSPFGGDFSLKVYVNSVDGAEHIALVKGDIGGSEPVPVRVHALNPLEDLLGIGRDGARHSLVERAMRAIGKQGRGVLVLIRETCATAVTTRLHSDEAKSALLDNRLVDYGVGAQILLDLGVRRMVLLSNSPLPKVVGLEGYGLTITGRLPLE